MAGALLGSIGALIGTTIGLHQALSTPGTSSHRPPSVKAKTRRRVHPYPRPKSSRVLERGYGGGLTEHAVQRRIGAPQIQPPSQHQRPVGGQVHPLATARAMAKRKRASSKRRSRKPKRGKKSFKRKSHKKRGKRSIPKVRAAIMDILQQDKIFTYSCAETVVMPVTTVDQPNYVYKLISCRATGSAALNQGRGGTYPHSHVCVMADNCHAGAAGNLTTRFLVPKYKYTTRIMNESNGFATITAYQCRWREDMGSNSTPLELFNTGLLENSITPGTLTLNNSYWVPSLVPTEGQILKPFQSPKFCQHINIDRQKVFKLGPGKQILVSLSSKKRRQFRPGKYITPTSAAQTFLTAPQTIYHLKNSRFWLFRVEGQLADTVAAAGNVTMTHPSVSFFSEYETHFKCLDPNVSQIISGGCAGLAAGAALTEAFTNTLTGGVTTFANT